MRLRVGYDLKYLCPQPTPMILNLSIHYSRVSDVMQQDHMILSPSVPVSAYRDSFGNWCSRIIAPPGLMQVSAQGIVHDNGLYEEPAPWAQQRPVPSLPDETLVFLLGSRYCETDLLSETAWNLFSGTSPGWTRVQAVCDFVHRHVTFGYRYASATKTAFQVFGERRGVCRDFAHLAITLCRCLNIPARYCTGYLGDIGVPATDAPMDFAGWFEAYLGDAWYTFDARNNTPRIGRVLIARGRDAADVAISTTFGPTTLQSFQVWTDEVAAA
jgi:transglutaminase-like putative cysteine protease